MLKRQHGYYPFLGSTKSAVRSLGIPADADVKVIELAKQRVLSALQHGRLPTPSYFSSEDILNDVRAYAVSRIIISLLNRKLEQFVEAESARAIEICRQNHDEDFLMSELGIRFSSDSRINLRDYLVYGSTFSSMLLSNREVAGGMVRISEHEKGVILKEAIKRKIAEGLPIRESAISDTIKAQLRPALNDILSELSLRSPALGRQSQDIAPCMERVIDELRSGAKVPHLKRWALAVFLLKRGWDSEKIIEVFSHAQNFDRKIVQYQLDHIRSKGYSMPSCHNLRAQGICVAQCGIKNPLQYRKGKRQAGPEETT
ncbi:MAG: hypothetical protein N3G76_01435 [Candidatus Micrarchaeota archaeon]|nr:hypothetical protein [Candidatus Micrarchaeota archaeon]